MFGFRHGSRRQQITNRVPQHFFCHAALDLVRRWNRHRELDQPIVQQRHARFEPDRHAGLIDLLEVGIGQPSFGVNVHEAIHLVGSGGGREVLSIRLQGIVGFDRRVQSCIEQVPQAIFREGRQKHRIARDIVRDGGCISQLFDAPEARQGRGRPQHRSDQSRRGGAQLAQPPGGGITAIAAK